RVLHRHQVLALRTADAELGDRGRRVGQQAPAEVRIDPGTGDDQGAESRTDLVLEGVDHRVDGIAGDDALLDEQGLQGAGPLAGGRERAGDVCGHPGPAPSRWLSHRSTITDARPGSASAPHRSPGSKATLYCGSTTRSPSGTRSSRGCGERRAAIVPATPRT